MTAREKFGRSEAEWDEIVAECVRLLEETARDRHLISYSELADRITTALGISPPIDHHLELSHILYDAVLLGLEPWPDAGTAPLLSALAVYKYEQKPGPGHITLAKELGRRPGDDEDAQLQFWLSEVQALYQHYRNH